MGLKKKEDSADLEPSGLDTGQGVEVVDEQMSDLLELLHSGGMSERRRAAGALAKFGTPAVEALMAQAGEEREVAVREAVFSSLTQIAGDEVARGLVPLMRHDDAAIRNNALEALQAMPQDVLGQLPNMLEDEEVHVRIFAVNLMAGLELDDLGERLLAVAQSEAHVNVLGTALDHLAEVATPAMVPALEQLRAQWSETAFIAFVIDSVIARARDAG